MSDKPEKIEWKRLQASNGDSYYGYFNGLQVAYIMDVGLPDEYILNFGDNSKPEYFNAVGLAKGRGEEMLDAWLIRVDLAKPSEWISVDDRLPEESGSYFVCLENDMATEFNFSDIGARPYWFKVGFGSEVEENKVTHWQPLPSPPTRETP